MTVTAETSRISYSGNGITTAFSVPFQFLADGDIAAYLSTAAGVVTPLTLSTHYTLTGAGDPTGGTLTMLTAPASGTTLVILRDPAITQDVDYTPNDPFPATTHETALDRLTMISQRLFELAGRSIRLADGDTTVGGSLILPERGTRASKFLTFDASGDLAIAANVGTTVVSQAVIGALLYPNAVFLTGADPTGATDSTTAIQSALNTGKDVLIPSGTYKANNLTQSTNFQRIIALGEVKIQKNANGAILTCSGNDIELNGIGFRGDAASPTFTGDGIVISGANPRINNCGSRWISGRPLKVTGSGAQVIGTCDIYQTTDATASGHDIELGVSGTATLYHRVIGIKTTQATGGILCIDTGNVMLSESQFGKLTIQSGTSPAGVNGGQTIGCRILGNVTVGLSNATLAANMFSTVTITLGAGTSGHSFDESNVLASGATLTDNSNNSSVVDSRQIPITTYTPSWTAATVNPAIGNGTISGRYTKRGRVCTVQVQITAGSTTTFGTGVYRVSLPFVPLASNPRSWGNGLVVDSGTANYQAVARTVIDGTANVEIFTPNQISPTVPMTWANGDSLDFSITYLTAS